MVQMGSDLNSPSSLYTSRPRYIPGEPPGQPSNSLRYPPNLQNPLSDLQYRPSLQIASAGLQYAPSNLQYPPSSLQHPALSLQIPPGSLQRPPSSLQTSGPESENSERLQTYLQVSFRYFFCQNRKLLFFNRMQCSRLRSSYFRIMKRRNFK